MKKLLILLVIICFSCQKKEHKSPNDKSSCSKDKKFEVYQMSEMASLMEQMYVFNLQIKDRIVKGDTIGKYPEFFNKIFTAKLTDATDKDPFFDEKATAYIVAQKLIYSDSKNAKQHFNEGVTACITCHEGKCGGPIPKIKKLYIK
jgi:cytochrome c553